MKRRLLILMTVLSVVFCGCAAKSENEEQGSAEAGTRITDGAGQDGTGQNSTGQNGTGQSSTGQDGTGQSGTEQNGAGQSGTGQNGAGQNSTGQNIAAGNNGTAVSARDNTAAVPEERIIQEQSFPVELDGWGRVEFVSCEPDHSVNFDDVSFFLVKDGQILYRFPYYCEGNDTSGYIGLFDSVEAVGFRDMNRDGKDDIVIIINYITGAGPQGMIPRPTARIFLAGEKEFYLAEDMMSEVSEHMQESEMTVDEVYHIVTDTSSGQGAPAAGNATGSVAKTPQDGSVPDAYRGILDSVYKVILGKDEEAADGGLIGTGVREARIGRTVEETLAGVGYALYDVDGNGVQELIIADTGEGLWDNRILNMYTIREDKPVTVIDGWARNRYYILGDGRIYYEGSGGAAYTTFATYRIGAEGLDLEPIDYYFTDYPDDAAYAVGVTAWFHNTTGEEDVKKSELMEFENDQVPWKMQEELEAQVMALDLTFFSDYGDAGVK